MQGLRNDMRYVSKVLRRRGIICAMGLWCVAALIAAAGLPGGTARAEPPANDAFAKTWSRTDLPVADLTVSRTWMWGADAFTAQLQEDYTQAPGGKRTVQYYDKSRMEINPDTA